MAKLLKNIFICLLFFCIPGLVTAQHNNFPYNYQNYGSWWTSLNPTEFLVTNSNDSGPGSLREIINQVNQASPWTSEKVKIGFRFSDFGGMITINTPLPPITVPCIIDGATFIDNTGNPIQGEWPQDITLNAGTVAAANSVPFQYEGYYSDDFKSLINNYWGFISVTLMVTNTSVLGPGSFNQAIRNANILPSTKDIIQFNIPGPAPILISGINDYDYDKGIIKGQVIIDGASQPLNGSTTSGPRVELSNYSLIIESSDVTISGLHIHDAGNGISVVKYDYNVLELKDILIENCVINRNDNGISLTYDPRLLNDNVIVSNVTIRNNIIGLLPDGQTPAANNVGINLEGIDIKVIDNVISGNDYAISNHSSFDVFRTINPVIQGNKIGTDINGLLAVPNSYGIHLTNPDNALIGGDLSTERNIISGNVNDPIYIQDELISWNSSLPSTHKIKGNYIGTDISGINPLPNVGGIQQGGRDFKYEISNNIIAFNGYALSTFFNSLIKNNSIFNNTKAFGYSYTDFTHAILLRSTTQITGKTKANYLVQLFYDDGPNNSEQGKTFIAEVLADNNGDFVYNGPISNPCEVVAIAFDPVNKTSTIFTPINYSMGPDKVACNFETVTLDAGPGTSYLWSTGETSQTIQVSTSGNYFVEKQNGCSMKDTVNVSFYASPTVNLGKDTTLCSGQSLLLDAGNPDASYVWNNNTFDKSKTKNISSSGKYWVDINYGSCKTSDTINVAVTPSINVNLGADRTVCTGTSIALDAGNAGANFLWSSGKTTPKDTILTPGKYWVRAWNSCFTKADTILVNHVTLNQNLGKDTTMCASQTLLLDAGNPGSTYQWNNSSSFINQTRNISTAGTYFVRVTQGTCINRDTIVVSYSSPINLNLGIDSILCNTAVALTLNAQNAGALYSWSTGETSQSISAGASGKYWVKVSRSAYCFKKDTISLNFVNCEEISGTVYNDLNSDCTFNKLAEKSIKNLLVTLRNNDLDLDYYALTDTSGNYKALLPLGNYKVNIKPSTYQIIKCPALEYYSINLNGIAPAVNKNFGIEYNPINDLEVNINSTTQSIRLGTSFKYVISYINRGNIPINSGTVKLLVDKFLTCDLSGIQGATQSGDTIIWDFNNILPGMADTIKVNVLVPLNISLRNSEVCSKVIISSASSEINYNNNADQWCNTLSYPYDPNNKLVTPKGTTDNGFIAMTDSILTYTVNFQNTGNDTAYTVVIIDTLSNKLDVSSTEMLGASHPYTYDISGLGIIKWEFKNIMLADSIINEPASHGFVSFRIKIKSGLPEGTVISNQANIYFDLAPAVPTNVAKNILSTTIVEQTITFSPPIAGLNYASGGVKLNGNSSSGLNIVYSVLGPGTIQGDSLIITGAGDVRVRAYQTGNENFENAEFKDVVFSVAKASQVISFDAIPDKFENDPSFTLTATGGNSGQPIIYSVVSGPAIINNNEVSILGVGTVAVTATQSGNDNYESANDVTQTFEILQVNGVNKKTLTESISIYPNPCKSELTLNLTALKDVTEANAFIFTMEGIKVKQFPLRNNVHTESDINLKSGVYTLKISVNGNDLYKMLIVE